MSRRVNPKVKKDDPALPIVSDDVKTTREYPKELPYGPSLFPEIWRTDPTSSSVKVAYTILALVGLTSLFFSSTWVAYAFPNVDKEWDQRNGINSDQSKLMALPLLVQKALHLSPETVHTLFQATGWVCVILIIADHVLAGSESDTSKTSPWPISWNTDNTLCYTEMFSEPTRFGRLIRRPGNALSNAPYLLGSLCVLASVAAQFFGDGQSDNNAFWFADAEFGIMLFILAVLSFLWHGSNAPWSQYVDIWAMDCCILYLIIRDVCTMAIPYFWIHMGTSPESAQALAGGTCAVLYTAVIGLGGRDKYTWFKKGFLNGGCPFSVRARLLGVANIFGQGQEDVWVRTAALFGSMPVLFISVPLGLELYLLKNTGSAMAGALLAQSLVIGWNYRMLDRWLLDGNACMNYFCSMKPFVVRTVGAAIFSPTAILHAFTGITLLAGYIHSRSMDHSWED